MNTCREVFMAGKYRFITLECSRCGKSFERSGKHHRSALKQGQKTFRCSNACSGAGTAVKISCGSCGKEIQKSPSALARSKSGRSFCSKSCATRKNNSFRVKEKNPNWTGGSDYRRPQLVLQPKCVACTWQGSIYFRFITSTGIERILRPITWKRFV